MAKAVLAFDLGGTKLLGAVVDEQGKILRQQRQSVDASGGPKALLHQIAQLSLNLQKEFPHVQQAALASAGPLDPVHGLWLNLTNITTDGQHWGVVSVIDELRKATGLNWLLENDAAAAIRAEVWQGQAKGVDDAISVTLGTGLGVGVWANGALVRAGRHLHPEAGHIIIEHNQKEVLCGCGNWGCAEAYLSGVNFTKWLAKKWGRALSGEELVALARAGDVKALQEFHAYGERLATFLFSLSILFCPRVIVLSGGFSHASNLFLPQTEVFLQKLLATRRVGEDLLPKIMLSRFQDEAGALGAAQLALMA